MASTPPPAYTYIDTSGLVIPDTANIQSQVQAEYTAAFGTDLNVTAPNTPQGLLINAETQARVSVATNNAAIANQINPNYAGGVFLDAILALTGATRLPQTYSTVLCNLTGIPGTVIPAGSIAQDSNGYQWMSATEVTFITSSLDSIQFQSITPGSIAINPNELTIIISAILGWQSITNPLGTNSLGNSLGSETQTDAQARQYRNNTLYLQGTSLPQAIVSGLYATLGVTSVSFTENTTSSTTPVMGVTMVANSIYVCVAGTQLIGSGSLVLCNLTGTAGAVISAGSQAQDTTSQANYWQTLAEVTLSGGGTATGVIFECITSGQVAVPPTELSIVVTPAMSGTWSTVSNPDSQYQLGEESIVAQTLVATKSAGAAYNNGAPNATPITAQIIVPFSGQIQNVLFDLAGIVQIGVQITVNITIPIADPIAAITTAITNYASGLVNGFAGLGIGDNVSAFEISSAVVAQLPGVYISNCLVSNLNSITQLGTIINTDFTITGLSDADILLSVGMSITGTGIQADTVITQINSSTEVTMSLAATGSHTAESIVFNSTPYYSATTIGIGVFQIANIAPGNVAVNIL